MQRNAAAREDVHHKTRQLAKLLLDLSSDGSICQANRTAILEYLQHRELKGDSTGSRYLRLWQLRKVARTLQKDFRKASKQELNTALLTLNKHYSAKTMCDIHAVLKPFFAWLYDAKRGDYPDVVKDLTTTLPKRQRRARYGVGDILSREEVLRISNAAMNLRDRAMPLVLYESGARISELVSMSIGSVVPDSKQNCCWITIYGKTGERTIPLYWSKGALLQWLEAHPLNGQTEAALWISIKDTNHRQLSYTCVKDTLRRNSRRAGVKKCVNPHLFRHSRATECASNGWNESDLKLFFGWTDNSSMPATYIHRSSKSVLFRVMQENNVQLPQDKESAPKPKLCSSCGAANPSDAMVCQNCKAVTTPPLVYGSEQTESELKKWV